MIYDALLILWDCSQSFQKDTNLDAFANQGDAEIFSRIREVARSHHRIQNFVEGTSFHMRKAQPKSKNHGLYTQALSEGITEVLQSYKKTLVEVEGLVIGNHTYTLSFVYSYVEKYRSLFNTLNRMISMIKERRLVGCQILSITHQHILNGNELVHAAVLRIFSNINKVFVNQLCSWLLYGDLKDPHQEFFITRTVKEDTSDSLLSCPSSTNTADRSLVSALQDAALECGYALNPSMIPYFVPLSLAQEVLFVGKTVILFGCDPRKLRRSEVASSSLVPVQQFGRGDSRRFTIWADKEAEFHTTLQQLTRPDAFEVSHLRAAVRATKECVTRHLWAAAVAGAGLLRELRLLKDFYLLGRGELFLELLRLSAHLLDNQTTRTGTRDMNQAFQLAARAVFLGDSADVDKFSFELPHARPHATDDSTLEDSSAVSDGWSSIILKYNFTWPLHLLFTAEVMARYNDMFRLLLRIKKTQHDLHVMWNTYKHSTSYPMFRLHNKLMFLMDNLQHYLQADVLETNFSRFMETISKSEDFETLRTAHATFLADILSQSFLTVSTSADSSSGDSTESLNNPVSGNIAELLRLCHSYCGMRQSTETDNDMYYITGYSDRFNKLVKQLMQQLAVQRERACGVHLARLLMRLDYNRWLSGEARLTQSVTNMLR